MALSPNLRGIAAILVATGSFVANDTCMKLALADAPPFQVLVMRGIAAFLWCLPVIYAHGAHPRAAQGLPPLGAAALGERGGGHPLLHHRAGPDADRGRHRHRPDRAARRAARHVAVLRREGGRPPAVASSASASPGRCMVAQPGGVASSPFAIFGFLTAVGAAFRDILSRKVPAAHAGPRRHLLHAVHRDDGRARHVAAVRDAGASPPCAMAG